MFNTIATAKTFCNIFTPDIETASKYSESNSEGKLLATSRMRAFQCILLVIVSVQSPGNSYQLPSSRILSSNNIRSQTTINLGGLETDFATKLIDTVLQHDFSDTVDQAKPAIEAVSLLSSAAADYAALNNDILSVAAIPLRAVAVVPVVAFIISKAFGENDEVDENGLPIVYPPKVLTAEEIESEKSRNRALTIASISFALICTYGAANNFELASAIQSSGPLLTVATIPLRAVAVVPVAAFLISKAFRENDEEIAAAEAVVISAPMAKKASVVGKAPVVAKAVAVVKTADIASVVEETEEEASDNRILTITSVAFALIAFYGVANSIAIKAAIEASGPLLTVASIPLRAIAVVPLVAFLISKAFRDNDEEVLAADGTPVIVRRIAVRATDVEETEEEASDNRILTITSVAFALIAFYGVANSIAIKAAIEASGPLLTVASIPLRAIAVVPLVAFLISKAFRDNDEEIAAADGTPVAATAPLIAKAAAVGKAPVVAKAVAVVKTADIASVVEETEEEASDNRILTITSVAFALIAFYGVANSIAIKAAIEASGPLLTVASIPLRAIAVVPLVAFLISKAFRDNDEEVLAADSTPVIVRRIAVRATDVEETEEEASDNRILTITSVAFALIAFYGVANSIAIKAAIEASGPLLTVASIPLRAIAVVPLVAFLISKAFRDNDEEIAAADSTPVAATAPLIAKAPVVAKAVTESAIGSGAVIEEGFEELSESEKIRNRQVTIASAAFALIATYGAVTAKSPSEAPVQSTSVMTYQPSESSKSSRSAISETRYDRASSKSSSIASTAQSSAALQTNIMDVASTPIKALAAVPVVAFVIWKAFKDEDEIAASEGRIASIVETPEDKEEAEKLRNRALTIASVSFALICSYGAVNSFQLPENTGAFLEVASTPLKAIAVVPLVAYLISQAFRDNDETVPATAESDQERRASTIASTKASLAGRVGSVNEVNDELSKLRQAEDRATAALRAAEEKAAAIRMEVTAAGVARKNAEFSESSSGTAASGQPRPAQKSPFYTKPGSTASRPLPVDPLSRQAPGADAAGQYKASSTPGVAASGQPRPAASNPFYKKPASSASRPLPVDPLSRPRESTPMVQQSAPQVHASAQVASSGVAAPGSPRPGQKSPFYTKPASSASRPLPVDPLSQQRESPPMISRDANFKPGSVVQPAKPKAASASPFYKKPSSMDAKLSADPIKLPPLMRTTDTTTRAVADVSAGKSQSPRPSPFYKKPS